MMFNGLRSFMAKKNNFSLNFNHDIVNMKSRSQRRTILELNPLHSLYFPAVNISLLNSIRNQLKKEPGISFNLPAANKAAPPLANGEVNFLA